MRNKRTKILWLILALAMIALVFGMAACQNGEEEEEPEVPVPTPTREGLEFTQYMSKIHTGLTTGEALLKNTKEYYVNSECELYTREENLTVYYEACYRENRRLGQYYIRIFDNEDHMERLNAYYDGADLYVTVRDLHYVIREFGTLLLFSAFDTCLDVVDIGDLVYGKTMQEYFNEVTLLSQVLTKEDFTYARAGADGESIALGGDASLLLGVIDASMTALSEKVGETFDSVSDHYLGFRLSRLIGMEFGSINVDELRFNLTSGTLYGTKANVSGRMRDNSKYFIRASYVVDETTDEILSAKSLPKAYVYTEVSPDVAAYEGKALLPEVREDADFDIALDYDVNPRDNADNRFTARIYDQLATDDEFDESTKYANIKELLSGYYRDELMYVNTEGMYQYINTAVALAALRLPKIFFSGVNLSSLMTLAYSDLLQLFNIIVSPKERNESSGNQRLYEQVMNAIESDVEAKTISVTITEELIQEIRGDKTDLAVVLGEALHVEEDTVKKYVGNDFFERVRIVLTYNFGTHVFTICVYDTTTLVAQLDLVRAEYYGIVYPSDLNDLTYAEFKEPEVVTVSYKIDVNPYGAESVDVSGFFGAFVGDSTGKNTPFTLTTGQSVAAEGDVSEEYYTDLDGTRKPVTTLDMKFYLVKSNHKTREIVMEVATDPVYTENFLVTMYTQVGSYADGATNPLQYVIARATVSEELDKLQGDESVFSGTTGLSAFLMVYSAVGKSARTYSSDGYFGANLMVNESNDPVKKLVGISDTNAIVRAKITFDKLDLSWLDVSEYGSPYIHTPDDVSASSIYSSGSAWKKTADVTVDGRRITMEVTYDEESVRIETGKTDYAPVAHLFGDTFGYALHIVDVSGTYKIQKIEALDENDVLIVDPAFYDAMPTTVKVTFEGGSTGELPCEIRGFSDARVTADGFNLSLFAGIKEGVESNLLVIGKDSIASMEKSVYVAVLNRQVIAMKDANGRDQVYVDTASGQQIPIVAEFVADPYTYAMKKRVKEQDGETYDYLAETIKDKNVRIDFYNVYGTEEVETGEGEYETRDLTFDRNGYNWFYVSDMETQATFSQQAFSWRGETRYAVLTYGTAQNNLVKFAIRVEITSKTVYAVQIDSQAEGTYLIDVLNEDTYTIPTTTTDAHTVRILFTDGTERIVSLIRSQLLSEDEYCETYVYGQLAWEGTAGLSSRLNLAGSRGLFGSKENASNVTSAAFGSEICEQTQTVRLNVIAPGRVLESEDYETDYLVTKIDASLNRTGNQASLVKTARFSAPTDDTPSFVEELHADTMYINPYNPNAVLPDTVWLYVRMEDGTDARREWVEYPVRWTTTDNSNQRNELNIVKKNGDNKFVLAHPVTQETKLIVYGQIGTSERSIWVAMRLLNMASDIRSYVLYLPNGEVFYDSENSGVNISVPIDPYLAYRDSVPSYFVATLGSGLTVDGATDWYYGDYPIVRENSDEYTKAAYDGYYRSDGYYMFSKEGSSGGTISLKMVVAQGEVSNDLYLLVSVSARHVATDADTRSSVVDVVNAGAYEDGVKYAGEGNPGYVDINYYTESSTILLDRLQAYYDNQCQGIAGFAMRELGEEKVLYAKWVKWDKNGLEAIMSMLKKQSSTPSYTLTGWIDEGKRNQTTVAVVFAVNQQKTSLSSVVLTRSQDMINKDVYAIANDVNNDRSIASATESSKLYMTNVAYYRNLQYKKFATDSEDGYNDASYDGFIYFKVDKTFMLSMYSNGAYTSPYEYFRYLFGSMRLVFVSSADEVVNASDNLELLGRTEEFFNASVLGYKSVTLEKDARDVEVSYSFIELNKLSQGSAIDRYLIIVEAVKATAESLVRQDVVDGLNGKLEEAYDPYNLPSLVEVTYAKTDKSGSYKAKFAVDAWTPANKSADDLGTAPIAAIGKDKIDLFDGKEYLLYYTLPDSESAPATARNFNLTVSFLKKDMRTDRYSAEADNPLFDIVDGKIVVDNTYAFLTVNPKTHTDKNERYLLDTSAVPTTIRVTDTSAYKTQRGTDLYEVKWKFEEANVKFGESIFREGTSEEGLLVATCEFDCYYHGGVAKKQIIELRLVLAKMEFYGLESTTLTVTTAPTSVAGTENERKNTIEIDPYVMTGDTFRLPTTLTMLFNGTQRYTFTQVEYMLAGQTTDDVLADSQITSVPYGEDGHKIFRDDLFYVTGADGKALRTVLKLAVFVRGYTQDSGSKGLTVYLHFLQHEIVDAAIPNNRYDKEGAYVYREENGKIAYEDNAPIVETYTAYATCGDERLPVYYIDPYNSATFTLPGKARFAFRNDPETYHEYAIGGWQYLGGYGVYEDIPTVANGRLPDGSARFYATSSAATGYYLVTTSSYEGETYALRGYIQVGSDRQYFTVLCVVLTRKLRATVLLNEEYTVSYDFTDPVAAMLSDIPAVLGDDAFVDFDKYNEEIDVRMLRNGEAETVVFTIGEDDQFSQKDGEGNPTNFAVTPKLEWNDVYEIETDGETVSVTFEELTTIGYDGVIEGNLYRNDRYLADVIDYYRKKANAEYDRLIAALSWDTLFGSDGNPSTSYSDSARNGIRAEKAAYEQEVVYATYRILTESVWSQEEITAGRGLDSANVQVLSYTLFEQVFRELNIARTTSGQTALSRTDQADRIVIVNGIYDEVKAAYEEWTKEGGTISSEAAIYRAWVYVIEAFRSTDVRTGKTISANQALKAAHFTALYNTINLFNAEERKKLDSQTTVFRNNLSNYIRADIRAYVYGVANAYERSAIEEYDDMWKGSGDTITDQSMAFEQFELAYLNIASLGAKGERASADVTMPVITLTDLVVNNTTTSHSIRFNKFTFSSIDRTFTLTFAIDYAAVYEKMAEEAKTEAILGFRDDKKEESLDVFEEGAAREAVDAVNPKVLNALGEYDAVLNFHDSFGSETGAFDYDAWISSTSSQRDQYAGFWTTLYEYRRREAVKVVTDNIEDLSDKADKYAAMSTGFRAKVEDVERVVGAIRDIKIYTVAREVLAYAEKAYDLDSAEGRKNAIKALVAYVIAHDGRADTQSKAYVRLGLPGTYGTTNTGYEATDAILQIAEETFLNTEMPEIIELAMAEILSGKDLELAEGTNTLIRVSTEDKRREALQALAEYFISIDVELTALDETYDATEETYLALLAKNMMTQYADGRTAASQAITQVGEVTSDALYGYAILFREAYGEEFVDRLYSMINSRFSSAGNAEYSEIQIAYQTRVYVKAGIVYACLNSEDSEIRTTATMYLDYLLSYAIPYKRLLNGQTETEETAYGLLLASEDLFTLTNLTAAEIETRNGDENRTPAEGCLLYYALRNLAVDANGDPTNVDYRILVDGVESMGLTAAQAKELIGKRILFETFYAQTASTPSYRARMNAMKDASRRSEYVAAAKRMIEWGNPQVSSALVQTYDTTSKQKNMNYYAFVALVQNAQAAGEAQGEWYEKYAREYIDSHVYRTAETFLTQLQAAYEEMVRYGDVSDFTGGGLIADTFYRDYFDGRGYLTPENYADDYHDTAYLFLIAQELAAKNGVQGANASRIVESYLKDTLLRAVVYYCENVATPAQVGVVKEVLEMFVGSELGDRIEREMLRLASAGSLKVTDGKTVGQNVVENLQERDDLGANAMVDLMGCYYVVWTEEALEIADKRIDAYDEEALRTKKPYLTVYPGIVDMMKAVTGHSGLTEEERVSADAYALAATRSNIKTTARAGLQYETLYRTYVQDALLSAAKEYAYDRMYEARSERGNYVYRDRLDDILTDLVLSQSTEVDRLIFEEARDSRLKSRTETLTRAAEHAAETVLLSEVFDKIKFFSLTPDEFAAGIYAFLTREENVPEDAAERLFGEALNGLGGIQASAIREAVDLGYVDETGTYGRYVKSLENWWTNTDRTPYGVPGEEEQRLIQQIYNQAYYQTKSLTGGETLGTETRKQLAFLTMLNSMYLFLCDVQDELALMPSDYFAQGNEQERKAYVIDRILNGNLMQRNSARSLSLAQATLYKITTDLAREHAETLGNMASAGDAITPSATEYKTFIGQIGYVLTYAASLYHAATLTEEEKEARVALFDKYYEKAVAYVEYTSILGMSAYDAEEAFPLRAYADAIYRSVTGYDMSGRSAIESEESRVNDFGVLSFGYYLKAAGGNYTAALAMMLASRTVYASDYVSQDFATDDDRHVLYFDRAEWDNYRATDGAFAADAFFSDRKVYVANPEKTTKVALQNDTYTYENTLVMQGYEYRLSDFTTVDLFFETTEDDPYRETAANILNIDALNPELPSKAYALGHAVVNGVDTTVQLGEVSITEYSSEFYKLVFNAREPAADDAYQVSIRAANGFVFRIINQVKVGYRDRSIRRVYLETGVYTEGQASKLVEPNSDFNGLYDLYDAERDRNVIYIEPTDSNLILAEQKTYAMPSTLYLRCVSDENKEAVVFTDVTWDLSNVRYGLNGTGLNGKTIRVKSYRYTDADGNVRAIEYQYENEIAVMKVYDGRTGALSVTRTYEVKEEDAIDWNMVLVVPDQSLRSLADVETNTILGTVGDDGVVDCTTIELNPYYPEYPSNLRLNLKEGGSGDNTTTLSQSDWIPNSSMLHSIQAGLQESGAKFEASFYYLGYEIKVRFSAMDVLVPKGEVLNGGVLYFVRGEGDVMTQFRKNYGYMYFNFGNGETDNWQKVPVALVRYGDVSLSETGDQVVNGIIGAESIGIIDSNVRFTVRVVDPKNYAMLNGEYNRNVAYDYYCVPSESGTKATSVTDEPTGINTTYLLADGTPLRCLTDDFAYYFIENEVKVAVEYDLDQTASDRIGYDEHGKRTRTFTFTMPMETYECKDIVTDSSHTNLSFNKDSSGKIWTWTNIPETDINYVDAIYWPIGRAMKASDLPKVYNRLTGESFSLLWDLNDLNVNLANVANAGEYTEGDGVELCGYYMTRNGWQGADPMRLVVYIEKIDITDAIVEQIGGVNIRKSYDAQFYTLPFNGDVASMSVLREDGSSIALGTDAYVVEYAQVIEGEDLQWSETGYPLNAGEYYIRVRFRTEDYNSYIRLSADGYLFRLTVDKCVVDMSNLKIEDEESGVVTRKYGRNAGVLSVESGLPSFTPANWFAPGEKATMYDRYRAELPSADAAKARVYEVMRARVSDSVKAVFDEWWKEGETLLKQDTTFNYDRLSMTEKDYAVKAWVFDNRMDPDLSLTEVKVTYAYSRSGLPLGYIPSDCGNYSVEIRLDEAFTNYTMRENKGKVMTLTIVKDTDILYAISNPIMTYNGNAQNPEITGLHVNGVLPYDVTVTYTYALEDKVLVVVVRGDRDESGNTYNVAYVDEALTTIEDPLAGIKNVQSNNATYVCSVSISGGMNFVDGTITGVAVSISKAFVYIDLKPVVSQYLSDVADLSEYVRVLDADGNEQEEGRLLGTDKLSDIGALWLSTPVGRHFKVGEYTTSVDGLKASEIATYAYTLYDWSLTATMHEKSYVALALKPADQDGSLYKDATANATLLELFNNYRIYVAGGTYTVEAEPGSEGLTGDTTEELKANFVAYINNLRDEDTKVLYLPELYDENGLITAYDAVTLNVAANLTIVGYRSNAGTEEEAEILTCLKGLRVLRGSVTLKILKFTGDRAGEAAVYLGENAGAVTVQSCRFEPYAGASDTVGLSTDVNYYGGQPLSIVGTTFYGLSTAIDLLGGELSVTECTFMRNYNGVIVRSTSEYISLRKTTFSNSIGKAVGADSDALIIRDNLFEYNLIALDLPNATLVREDVNNNNVFENNGDD